MRASDAATRPFLASERQEHAHRSCRSAAGQSESEAGADGGIGGGLHSRTRRCGGGGVGRASAAQSALRIKMFLLCSFFLHPASFCDVSWPMEFTQPHIAPKRDAAAELQSVLHAMRAEIGGWGLNAVLFWLLSRWIGRWIGQIAAQFERMVQMMRAGHVWPEPKRAVAPHQPSASLSRPAAPTACRSGWLERVTNWLEDGGGSPTPERRVSWPASRQATRTAQPVCRVLTAEPSTSMTARAEFDPSMRELAPHSVAVRMPLPCGVRIRVPWQRSAKFAWRTPCEAVT